MNARGGSSQTGFTLIEVMVALVVVSVSLVALTHTLGNFVYQQSGLQERTAATWVAQNRLIESQFSGGETLEKRQQETLLGIEWQTELSTEPTLIPGIIKAELSVSIVGDDRPTAKVVSIVGQ